MPETWVGSIPGLQRCPEGGHGNQLQYSCLGNPTARGAWQATVHGVAKSDTAEATVHTQGEQGFLATLLMELYLGHQHPKATTVCVLSFGYGYFIFSQSSIKMTQHL